jgi:hypothetical protein
LKLLQWLVDEHCCPLRSIRVSSGKQKDTKSGSYTPILTSKGRSLLNIALTARNIGIVRYLVVEKRMLLWAEKDLSMETLVQNLDLVLRILPEETLAGQQTHDDDAIDSAFANEHQYLSHEIHSEIACRSADATHSISGIGGTELSASIGSAADLDAEEQRAAELHDDVRCFLLLRIAFSLFFSFLLFSCSLQSV